MTAPGGAPNGHGIPQGGSRLIWPGVALLAALVLTLLAGEAWRERAEMRQYWSDRLAAIGLHQQRLIGQWLAERRADALVVADFPTVGALLAPPAPAAALDRHAAEHLRSILQNVADKYRYEGVWLLDPDGTPMVQAGMASLSDGTTRALVEAVAATPVAVVPVVDAGGRLLLATAAAVRDESLGANAPLTGVVVSLARPARRLWPLLEAESTGTRSGESLLLEPRGDQMRLLSKLRHGEPPEPDGAARLADDPLARLALSSNELLEVDDYRGEPVLAVARAIPELGWRLLVKVDRAEAVERLHAEWRRLAAMAVLVILAAGGVGLALSRREQARGLVAELARERALQAEREHAAREIRQLNAELEARVRERTAALETANRELESFNYSVSHDLRAPLRHIDGYLRMLEEDCGAQLPEAGREYVRRVIAASRRMGELIDALLQLSRVGRAELQRRPVALGELARAVFDEVRGQEGERVIELVVRDLPLVDGDPVLLRQLLQNLLGNAVKFTRPRPRAHIEVGVEPANGHSPAFYVRDDGVGFDPAYADKLFRVFHRLHNHDEFEGHGVGLSIVRRIVEKHGGTVWADGRPDGGATVHFTIGAA